MITIETPKSSNIKRIAYEEPILFVTFLSGGTYKYENVPVKTWELFKDAESKGKFFHADIKKNFVGVKL